MRQSVLFKDFLKEIWVTKSRFLSIMLIVALGTGFFAGIKATGYDMLKTSDTYFDEKNLYDAQVMSTLGLSENDIAELSQQPNVKEVSPAYQYDFIMSVEDSSTAVRVHSYEDGKTAMNQFTLVSGRLPKKAGEILAEDMRDASKDGIRAHMEVGQIITLDTGTDSKIKDVIKTNTYTIVGTVVSPFYISVGRGTTTIGTGSITCYMYLPSSTFTLEAYTTAYIKLADTGNLPTFSNEYQASTKKLAASLSLLEVTRSVARMIEVKAKPLKKVNDAETTLNEEREKGLKELSDAWYTITSNQQKLFDSEKDIKQGWTDYYNQLAQGETQLANARAALIEGERQYTEGLELYNAGKATFEENYAAAVAAIQTAEALLTDVEAGMALAAQELATAQGNYDVQLAEWETLNTEAQESQDPALLEAAEQKKVELDQMGCILSALNAVYTLLEQGTISASQLVEGAKQQLINAEQLLKDTGTLLDNSRLKLDNGYIELQNGASALESGRASGAQLLRNGEAEIKDGWVKLANGKADYYSGKLEFDEKISDAEKKIADAKKKIDKIEPAKWYTTVRDKVADISEYRDNANRIDKIATVFPVFFLVIAALVCLTTMTRMVDDQRVQIGTLKAMGYSRFAVAKKYLLYALLASLAGSVLGVSLGFIAFPSIIFSAYSVMLYRLPSLILSFQWSIALPTILVSVLAMVSVTFFTCFKSLKTEPAGLLRPAAPKSGKRIFLEHIDFIWKRLSFSWKVTLRNLFRYKKRMLMTIVGIAGCTALMMAGFVLKDAISGTTDVQFSSIFKYDMMVALDTNASDYQNLDNYLENNDSVTNNMLISNVNASGYSDGAKEYDVTIVATNDTEKLKNFIDLHDRGTKEAFEIQNDGVIISEKLADMLGLSVGDYITLDVSDIAKKVKITAIAENYTFNYAYMTETFYTETYGKAPVPNRVMLSLDSNAAGSEAVRNKLSEDIVELDNVLTVVAMSDSISFMDDQMAALDTVIYVLVGCAGLLAFIVMYNLTNINIMERTREIATIKVLGFYEKETSAYVYRENILLSIIGAGVGLLLGIVLGRVVTETASIDMIMFGTNISAFSFIISFVLTMVFTFIVRIAVNFRLKHIDMIEALKSVD